MDADQVRRWKSNYDAVNRVTLEEARNRTPAERLLQHRLFLGRLAEMGRLPVRNADEKFYLRWQYVKKLWLERHPTT